MVRQFEGYAELAYPDGTYYSIGYGHHGPEVIAGVRMSREEAERVLVSDLESVASKVTSMVAVPLTQGQFDALVSFVYNVGVGAFKKSTLLRKFNAGDYEGAAKQFGRWNKVGGIPVHGLTRRRDLEELCFRQGI